MADSLKDSAKRVLLFIGTFLSVRAVFCLDAAINYLELGRWMRAKGYETSRRFAHREDLYDLIGKEVGQRDVLYMEFGVYQGEATRYWSKLLLNPRSRLHGFDSFEGLPENWLSHIQKGHFDTDGAIPQIEDPRVKFFKGWFQDTLPNYEYSPHEILVINLDADLYSSTIYVLRALKDRIIPGTYLYFDEFCSRRDELRAFDEFINETGMKFSLLWGTQTLRHVVFRRDG
ncbi:MAG: TylF/MycF/NovP-related O-methyltransferase [Terracidiphilus sp.]